MGCASAVRAQWRAVGCGALLLAVAACGAGEAQATATTQVPSPTTSVGATSPSTTSVVPVPSSVDTTLSTTLGAVPMPSSTTVPVADEPTDPSEHLRVVEVGGYLNDSLGWTGALGVANDASDPITVRSMTMRWRDARGQVVDTATEFDRFFPPGATAYFAARMWRVDGEPVTAEIEFDGARLRPHLGNLAVTQATLTETLQGSVDLVGRLQSTLEGDMSFVDVVVAFFDADGRLLWADSILVPEVPAGSAVPVTGRFGVPAAAPAWATFVVQAQP